MEIKEMTFEEWEKKYKPLKNHLAKNSQIDGFGFETYGDELDFVEKQYPCYIWTVTHGDGCECEEKGEYCEDDGHADYCEGEVWEIYNGMGIVNRVCYLITEIPEEREKMSITIEY